MKIIGLKQREIARIFEGDPRNTREDCMRLADLLLAEGIADTNELSFERWSNLIAHATGRPAYGTADPAQAPQEASP